MPGVGGAVCSSLLCLSASPCGGTRALYGKNSKAASNGKWGVGNSD